MTPPEAACSRLPPGGGAASGPAEPDPRRLLDEGGSALRAQRLSPDEPRHTRTAAALPPLGTLDYGAAAPCLGADVPAVDAWFTGRPAIAGQTGGVRWRHDGRWLFGALELDEEAEAAGLAALTARAYRDVFATLRETGCPHLLRVWNYLPRINAAEAGGLERYRQFNIGRQQAFLDAGQAAFEGAPAACALGTQGRSFSLRFLAGTLAPLALENPRQVSAYRYPPAYGPRSPSFSRAALLDAGGGMSVLLVSGTASIVGHATQHAGDVQAQTLETLRNLQAVIDAAHLRGTARFGLQSLDCTVYIRHAGDAPKVRAVLEGALGAGSPALRSAVFLQADICRADLLVEIEAHAFAGGVPHARVGAPEGASAAEMPA